MNQSCKRRSCRAFTFLELLALLALAFLGLSILAPALARTRPNTQTVRCLENLQRLVQAWQMYADDNQGRLVPILNGSSAQGGNFPGAIGPGWAAGWLDWTTSPDNTNLLFLVNPRYAALAGYTGANTNLFKCPSDTRLSPAQQARGWTRRVRSYSAAASLGPGNLQAGPWNSLYPQMIKISDLRFPSPAETFVHLDEDADSINDPAFSSPNATSLADIPATRHNGAATFSFADGHTQLHVWTGSLRHPVNPTSDPDLHWLSFHTSRSSAVSY